MGDITINKEWGKLPKRQKQAGSIDLRVDEHIADDKRRRQDKTRQARQGKTRQDKKIPDKAKQD